MRNTNRCYFVSCWALCSWYFWACDC